MHTDLCTPRRWQRSALFVAGLALSAASFAQPATRPASEGELTFYEMMTQTGIVARRDFHDDSGRLIKRVFYAPARPTTVSLSSQPAPSAVRGPFDPNQLAVRSTETYDYDRRGWLTRTSTYDPDGALTGYAGHQHDSAGGLCATVNFTADGRRSYEVRFGAEGPGGAAKPGPGGPARGRVRSHLYFEDSGQRLVAVRGALPEDQTWTWGWGSEKEGLSCAVAPQREAAPLGEMQVALTVRNLASSPREVAAGRGSYRPILRDADGQIVPIAEKSSGAAGLREPSPTTALTQPREMFHWDAFDLASWYPELAPGRYSLQVEYRGDSPEWLLVSNAVTITILAAAR